MIGSMAISPRFMAFLVASLILAITPGPGVVYIVTRTLAQGRTAGLASVGGIALGNLGNSIAASVGLAALLAASATAFAVIKLGGAAYLIYLGFSALRAKSDPGGAPIMADASSTRLFRDGFLVALLNPKTALFFTALLPQFIGSGTSPLAQSLLMGVTFVVVALCTDSIYVLAAAAIGQRIRRSRWRPVGKYVTAATFFGLGAYAALASPRHPR